MRDRAKWIDRGGKNLLALPKSLTWLQDSMSGKELLVNQELYTYTIEVKICITSISNYICYLLKKEHLLDT